MPRVLDTPALVNQLLNLARMKNGKIFVFSIWQARDQILMTKIEVHRRHLF